MPDVSFFVVAAASMVGLALPLLWWALAGARSSDQRATRNLLSARLDGETQITDLRQAVLTQSAGERTVQPLMTWMADRGRRLTPAGLVRNLERRIALAGRPAAWPLERVLGLKLLLALILGLLGGITWLSDPGIGRLLFWIAVTALGYFGPDILLTSRGQERQKAIQRDLPDTLDQMTICVEAGLGFEAAMARTGRGGSGPLADELIRTLQEMQVGVSRHAALKSLGERTTVNDLRHFVTAIQQAESFGIPVADVLRTQAAEMRVKRRQRAEEQAMKIPVKVIFPLIFCIMPTLFVVMIGPAVIRVGRAFLNL